MQVFYTPLHEQHNPPEEIYDGQRASYAEVPDRIETIVHTLREHAYTIQEPQRFSIEHIEALHQSQYIDFVRSRSAQLTNDESLFPSYYMSDTYAPIVHGTFDAAKGAVDTALTGAQALLENENVAYSLCRPPGHHAMHHSMGGYCYFNNAAIAANHLSNHGRVAILDIDFHHGNGTQDAFYDRADVFYVSLHADPVAAYPYSSGYADETGRGEGAGFNLNIPLPANTNDRSYFAALTTALEKIRSFAPDYLVVSAGFDTFVDDPIGGLNLSKGIYTSLGGHIAAMGLPTLIVQEGGYNVESLGELAYNFLQAFS